MKNNYKKQNLIIFFINILCFCIFTDYCLAEEEKDTITVQDESKVSGENILLGEISTIEGDITFIQKAENIVIGKTPLPGMDRNLRKEQIMARLKDNGISMKQIAFICPGDVKVVSDYTGFSTDDLKQITTRFIHEHMPWPQDDVKIEDFFGRPVTLPKGEVTYKFSLQNNEDYLGKFNADITFKVNGEELKKDRVTAFIRVMAPVAVCKRTIERHAPVKDSDISMVKKDISNLTRNIIMDMQAIAGKRTISSVTQGTVLQHDMFEVDTDIHRGDKVTIALNSDLMSITAPGEALEDGNRGDTIRVCNISSKSKISGIVKNSKEIEVRY